MDDLLFDELEEHMAELPLGGRAASTPETQTRWAFLNGKRKGDTWGEGRPAIQDGTNGGDSVQKVTLYFELEQIVYRLVRFGL